MILSVTCKVSLFQCCKMNNIIFWAKKKFSLCYKRPSKFYLIYQGLLHLELSLVSWLALVFIIHVCNTKLLYLFYAFDIYAHVIFSYLLAVFANKNYMHLWFPFLFCWYISFKSILLTKSWPFIKISVSFVILYLSCQ